MSYVYIPFQKAVGCATVGFYNPSGAWIPESDHPTDDAASRRVEQLNGCATTDALRRELDAVKADKERALGVAREALNEIHVSAHCTSKAGPYNTPTLDDAWDEFDRIAVLATSGLAALRAASAKESQGGAKTP